MPAIIPRLSLLQALAATTAEQHSPPAQTFLQSLLGSSLILAEDWERLPDPTREELTSRAEGDAVLPLLVKHGLLTPYQAGRIEAGSTFGLVLGNYRVLDRIGAGGMGVVFKGEHVRLRLAVAIKVLPFVADQDARLLQRFFSEMRTVALLQHPNIVAAIDCGEVGHPGVPALPYFVMEYVPGQDLEEMVRARGPLPQAAACGLAYQVAGALAEAHKHDLAHRDIKPSNIRVTPDGQAKVLDFGLVRQGQERMTEPGTVLGTLDYLAPEQARAAESVDGRADVYTLGGTLFWCLTGQTPFRNDCPLREALIRRQTQPPPSVRSLKPEICGALDEVVRRMMACDPADRYPTSPAVMKALLPFLNTGSSEQVIPPSRTLSLEPLSLPEAPDARGLPRVLVVDDSAMLRRYCSLTLRNEGIPCDEADTGRQALAAVGAGSYDLVLTDWMMPEMTGLEPCRKLRESPPCPHLKIVLFSAQVTDDDVAQALAAGADDFLTKQFSPIQLVARVKAALRLKDSQERADLLNRRLLACNQQLEQSLTARDSDLLQVRNALVLALADLVSQRDFETVAHAMRLQRYCRCLAEEAVAACPGLAAQIDRNFIQMLECCAPLHDIGKAGLPDHILANWSRLGPKDRLVMQTHTTLGAETLQTVAHRHGSAVAFLQMAIDIARHHHERYDGKGYPDRLAGSAIPLAARVLTVGAIYDGLRARRAYKPALPHTAALHVMLEESKGQFDPVLLKAFRRCERQFERIFREVPD